MLPSNLVFEEFKVDDPFNLGNTIAGSMCTQHGRYYGSLMITEINGEPQEQFILSVPKINYPYDKDGQFFHKVLPHMCTAYQKMDGTAIIAYAYEHDGKMFRTYKTRLTPVASSYHFSNFVEMWKEMLVKYPAISELADMGNTYVFELYGLRNKHLIVYPIELDTTLLFGINRRESRYFFPHSVSGIPLCKEERVMKAGDNFPVSYKEIQIEIEKSNVKTEDGIVGKEGVVIYIPDDKWGFTQAKCKPMSVMAEHCKPGMGRRDILITCYNALENVPLEGLTIDFVKKLLEEEVSINEIPKLTPLIEMCIKEVVAEVKLREEVITRYKNFGVSIREQKATVMRYMSSFFPPFRMRYIYFIIDKLETPKDPHA